MAARGPAHGEKRTRARSPLCKGRAAGGPQLYAHSDASARRGRASRVEPASSSLHHVVVLQVAAPACGAVLFVAAHQRLRPAVHEAQREQSPEQAGGSNSMQQQQKRVSNARKARCQAVPAGTPAAVHITASTPASPGRAAQPHLSLQKAHLLASCVTLSASGIRSSSCPKRWRRKSPAAHSSPDSLSTLGWPAAQHAARGPAARPLQLRPTCVHALQRTAACGRVPACAMLVGCRAHPTAPRR